MMRRREAVAEGRVRVGRSLGDGEPGRRDTGTSPWAHACNFPRLENRYDDDYGKETKKKPWHCRAVAVTYWLNM